MLEILWISFFLTSNDVYMNIQDSGEKTITLHMDHIEEIHLVLS